MGRMTFCPSNHRNKENIYERRLQLFKWDAVNSRVTETSLGVWHVSPGWKLQLCHGDNDLTPPSNVNYSINWSAKTMNTQEAGADVPLATALGPELPGAPWTPDKPDSSCLFVFSLINHVLLKIQTKQTGRTRNNFEQDIWILFLTSPVVSYVFLL